ncbi:hypothetical protein QLX08_010246 [Tetragonisca angustula]|uniref:Rhodanese domain-containing protein n=1 Tax=Tetragonisca angustula TaxID=166442 RepID=A0AAW0ZCW6_9HYME
MSALYGKQAPPCKRSLNESKRRAIEPRGWTRYSNGDIHVQSFPRATIGGYSRSSRAATYERERGQLSVPLVHTGLDAYTPQYPTPCATANVPKNGMLLDKYGRRTSQRSRKHVKTVNVIDCQ